jgi:uncharacterized membrane protein YgdD (TMEM256/DUF423 family)
MYLYLLGIGSELQLAHSQLFLLGIGSKLQLAQKTYLHLLETGSELQLAHKVGCFCLGLGVNKNWHTVTCICWRFEVN